MEDALVPLPCPILRCDHSEEAHVQQTRYPLTTTHVYYCCHYTVWVFNCLSLIWLCMPLDCVIVIERNINFVEAGAVQFLSVDWWARDVWSANSSVSLWSKWVLFVSQLQVLSPPSLNPPPMTDERGRKQWLIVWERRTKSLTGSSYG
jgi:hypothetical protein